MQVKYQLNIQSDDFGAGDFIKTYQAQRLDNTSIFVFEDKTLACEAVKTADKDGLVPQLFYIYQISPEETAAHSGFYFVPQTLDDIWGESGLDADVIRGLDIVEDFSTEFVFVNEKMKNILIDYCLGVKTVVIETNSQIAWYRLEEISILPEPIYIPRPMFLSPNLFPPDTFAVQSDGRDILTENNISWITAHGIAMSNEALTPSGRVKWRPRTVASGKLIARIQNEGIEGIESLPVVLVDSVEDECGD